MNEHGLDKHIFTCKSSLYFGIFGKVLFKLKDESNMSI